MPATTRCGSRHPVQYAQATGCQPDGQRGGNPLPVWIAASKAGGALVVARAIAPKRTASPAQPGCTTAPFAAVSATLHGAAFVCTNQVQIWRSLAAAIACLLRRGYTLDCQTWAADCCWRHWLLPLSPHRPVSGVELEWVFYHRLPSACVQIWRSLAVAIACLLRVGYTLDYQIHGAASLLLHACCTWATPYTLDFQT